MHHGPPLRAGFLPLFTLVYLRSAQRRVGPLLPLRKATPTEAGNLGCILNGGGSKGEPGTIVRESRMRLSLQQAPLAALVLLPVAVAYNGWGVLCALLGLAAVALLRQAILVDSIPK